MGAKVPDGRPRPVPFRWLIVAAIWTVAVAPVLIGALLGLIFGGGIGGLIGGAIGLIAGIMSYRAAMQLLKQAERR